MLIKLIKKSFNIGKIGKEIVIETRDKTPNMAYFSTIGDYSTFVQEFLNHCNNDPLSIMDKCYEPIIDDMNWNDREERPFAIKILLNEDIIETLKSYKEDHGIPMVRIFLATMYLFYTKMPKDIIVQREPSTSGVPLFLTHTIAELLTTTAKKYSYPPSVILKIGLNNLKEKDLPKKKYPDGTLNINRHNYEISILLYPTISKEFIKLYEKNRKKYYSRVNIAQILTNIADKYLARLTNTEKKDKED